MSRPTPTSRAHAFALLILAALAIVPYLPAIRAGWFFDSLILLDKPEFLNPSVAARQLWEHKWLPDQALSTLTFALNRSFNHWLGRDPNDPRVFIVFNIAAHAVTTLLVYLLIGALARLSGRPLPLYLQALAAAVFAVHPIAVNSVAYLVQRRGTMATLFYLGALLCYLRARVAAPPQRIAWALTTTLLAWLSMHSKATALTVPVALIVLEFCIRAPDRARLRHFFRSAIPLAVIILLAATGFLIKIGVLDPSHGRFRPPQTMVGELGFTWGQYLLTESRALAKSWTMLALPAPSRLCIDHDFRIVRDYFDGWSWLAIAFHAAIIFAAITLARRGNLLASFGILLFYVAALPLLAPPQPILFVEYRLYLPLTGLALLCAAALQWAAQRSWKGPVLIGGTLIIILLAIITWQRNAITADTERLWRDVVEKNPHLFRGHYNLANLLYKSGRFDEAEQHYEKAGQIDPDDFRSHFNRGNTLMKLGRRDEAVREYQETILRNSDHTAARTALRSLGIEVHTTRRD